MIKEPLSADPRQVEAALRAHLSEVLTAVELLLRKEPPEAEQNTLAAAYRGALKALNVVENCSLARRLDDEDERRWIPSTTDMVACVRGVTERAAQLLAPGGVQLIFRTDAEKVQTLADPELIERMLMCLFSNAVRAVQPAGKVTVDLTVRGTDILILVGDNGAGLTAETMERLFGDEPLPPDLTPGAGAGIGLRLARAIAETHGGQLLLDTGSGGGTRVAVGLPQLSGDRPRLSTPESVSDAGLWAMAELADCLSSQTIVDVTGGKGRCS